MVYHEYIMSASRDCTWVGNVNPVKAHVNYGRVEWARVEYIVCTVYLGDVNPILSGLYYNI